MRFMMLMIPKVYQGEVLPENLMPDAKAVEEMMKYNEELAKSGALVALDGLHPPSNGARIEYPGGKGTQTDGPFAEAKEVLGGYWMINVASKEEAINWAKRIPALEGDVVEVRPVFEMSDFPEDVQQAADSEIVRNAIGEG
jgi:hypothetical protein